MVQIVTKKGSAVNTTFLQDSYLGPEGLLALCVTVGLVLLLMLIAWIKVRHARNLLEQAQAEETVQLAVLARQARDQTANVARLSRELRESLELTRSAKSDLDEQAAKVAELKRQLDVQENTLAELQETHETAQARVRAIHAQLDSAKADAESSVKAVLEA